MTLNQNTKDEAMAMIMQILPTDQPTPYREIARRVKMSECTIRRALKILENEGDIAKESIPRSLGRKMSSSRAIFVGWRKAGATA